MFGLIKELRLHLVQKKKINIKVFKQNNNNCIIEKFYPYKIPISKIQITNEYNGYW